MQKLGILRSIADALNAGNKPLFQRLLHLSSELGLSAAVEPESIEDVRTNANRRLSELRSAEQQLFA